MTIKELEKVCPTGVYMFMHNKNTGESIQIPFRYDSQNIALQNYRIGSIPYKDVLVVQEIYSDGGLVAEIKFNKQFWRAYRSMFSKK